METLALALVGLAQASITVTAFTLMARDNAKQTRFLLNVALSKTPGEFVLRQSATDSDEAEEKQPSLPEQMPEGL